MQSTTRDKPHIERTLGSISTLFCQFVASHLGRSAEMRGRNTENGPLWSMLQLQELLDEWIVAKSTGWRPAEWCSSDLCIAPGHGAAIAQLSE
ncbi:hypothetical protein ACWCQP_48140 [Streptomyces chartreusis]